MKHTEKGVLSTVLDRVNGGKISASDIKYADRLSDEQIRGIPENTVYQWIQDGAWTLKDFKRYINKKQGK